MALICDSPTAVKLWSTTHAMFIGGKQSPIGEKAGTVSQTAGSRTSVAGEQTSSRAQQLDAANAVLLLSEVHEVALLLQ